MLRDTFGLLGPCLPALGVVTLVTWLFELLMAYGIRPPFEHLGPGGTQPPLGFNIVERLFWMVLKAATSAGFIRWLADGILQEEPRTLARVLKVALAGAFLLALQQLLSLFMVGLATLLVILPGIYLATSLSLASAAFVVDGLGPIAALQRSMAVVQGHWLRLFLALTPLFVLNAAIVLLTQQLPVLLGQEGDAERLATSVLSTAVATTTYGLLEIATVLAYLRLTRRPAPEPPPVPVEAPPASTEA
ncbi:MAG TPA: hypothetical protein VE153_40540 [Myxococcus sp.]|nr:hypothetical protein [Myxococcus sp.]